MTRFSERGAVVRIALEEGRGGTASLVLTGVGEPKQIPLKVRWSGLPAFRDNLAQDLYVAVRATHDILKLEDWDYVRGAVGCLANVGSRMMFDLLDAKGDRAFWRFLSDHFPRQFYPEPTESYEPPLIEVESPDEYIPFGLIPLVGKADVIRDGDVRSLRRAMFNFLGMKASIRHVRFPPGGDEAPGQDKLLWNRKGLPIKFFYDSSLPGALEEKHFLFDVMAGHIDADGPWPNERVNKDNAHAELASALWDTGRKFNGDVRLPGEVGDQVHHFSCHCYTEALPVSDYALQVRAGPVGPFDIKLSELKPALRKSREAVDKVDGAADKPLLFLNACGSAVGSPKDLPAFPQTFAESHRAVIGTETKISDQVAVIMAERFYLLLLGGLSAGESLHKAKWHLVDMYYNPLGALYTLHGESALRVSQPVAEFAER